MRRLHRRSRSVIALIASLFAVIVIGHAQCPTGWFPGTTTITLTAPCVSTVIVNYCLPGPGILPSTQYYITGLSFTPPCSSINHALMLAIDSTLIKKNPAGFPCTPHCRHGDSLSSYPQWNLSYGSCFQKIIYPDSTVLVPCNATGTCYDYFFVCCDSVTGIFNMFYVASTPSDDCGNAPGGCVPVCPGGSGKSLPATPPNQGKMSFRDRKK